jgi:hypothetical protein
MAKNIPNVHNTYISNGHKIDQPFTFQVPQKLPKLGFLV